MSIRHFFVLECVGGSGSVASGRGQPLCCEVREALGGPAATAGAAAGGLRAPAAEEGAPGASRGLPPTERAPLCSAPLNGAPLYNAPLYKAHH